MFETILFSPNAAVLSMSCQAPDENVTIGIEIRYFLTSELQQRIRSVQIPCSASKSNMKRIPQIQFVHPDVLWRIRPPDECKCMNQYV